MGFKSMGISTREYDAENLLFFEFLRIAIGNCSEFTTAPDENDWNTLYKVAKNHELVGICSAGLDKIPPEQRPPKNVALRWILHTVQIEDRNRWMNRKCLDLQARLTEDGFRFCILKGQGIALLYPNPLLRTSGDIDVWMEGGRKRVFRYVKGLFPKETIRYHHIDFPVLKDVPVEAHCMPTYAYNPLHNCRMQRWFDRNVDRQCGNIVDLPEDMGKIPVPTLAFNRIYILSHIYRHLFPEGVGLRQLMDYYFVLRQGFTPEEQREDIVLLKHFGLLKFAGAVMWVMQHVFGLEEKFLLVAPNKKEGEFLLSEVMIAGNFGKCDTRLGHRAKEGKWYRYFRLTFHNMRFIGHYPSEALCEPIFRTWAFLRNLLR